MVTSITGSQSSSIVAGLSPQPTTPSGSTDSFMSELTSALEGYLAQSGNNSNLEIDIQSTQSQDSGVRQFLVTVKNPDSASAPTVAAGSSATASIASAGVTTDPTASAAGATDTNGGTTDSQAPVTPETELDAYWAMQPPAVQQLRDIPDLGARSALATTLTNEGYTIDPQIMVWQWDPVKTMDARQAFGYAWAPHWNETDSPTQGDPSAGPAGSIPVNTDFANAPGVIKYPWG
jgi:hypothetical protein